MPAALSEVLKPMRDNYNQIRDLIKESMVKNILLITIRVLPLCVQFLESTVGQGFGIIILILPNTEHREGIPVQQK